MQVDTELPSTYGASADISLLFSLNSRDLRSGTPERGGGWSFNRSVFAGQLF